MEDGEDAEGEGGEDEEEEEDEERKVLEGARTVIVRDVKVRDRVGFLGGGFIDWVWRLGEKGV